MFMTPPSSHFNIQVFKTGPFSLTQKSVLLETITTILWSWESYDKRILPLGDMDPFSDLKLIFTLLRITECLSIITDSLAVSDI